MPEENVVCKECDVKVKFIGMFSRIINKGAEKLQSQAFIDVWYQELELYSCPSCKTIYPKIVKERKVQPFGSLKRI